MCHYGGKAYHSFSLSFSLSYLSIKSTGAREGRVKYVGTVGACEDNERGGASMRGCVIRE